MVVITFMGDTHLCFKARPGANPFIGKLVLCTCTFFVHVNDTFSYESNLHYRPHFEIGKRQMGYYSKFIKNIITSRSNHKIFEFMCSEWLSSIPI